MNTLVLKARQLGVGTRLSLITFLLVAAVFAAFAWAIGYASSNAIEHRAVADLGSETTTVVNMVELFDNDLKREAGRLEKILTSYYPEPFSVDAGSVIEINGKPTPALKSGDAVINLDFSQVDKFSERSDANATLFVKSGDDFIRVSTSVKKEDGTRAIGTVLDRTHPGYRLLLGGTSYSGVATLFGKQYYTQYSPIKDAAGKVIGVKYIGIDFTANLNALKEKIKKLKIGDSGYYYVLDENEGKDFGRLVVHPRREGQVILDETDSDGHAFIKDILAQKQGTLYYNTADNTGGGIPSHEEIAVFNYFPEWHWVIVANALADELTYEETALRNRYIGFGLVALLLLTALLYLAIRSTVVKPLAAATAGAQRLAAGDLTVRLDSARQDEIGLLMQAMNGISQGLANVVTEVRDGTVQVASAAQEISSGNADLSSRTESQASALEETASSMEELTSTVKQNADNARQASLLSSAASDVARKGGTVVAEVVQTMGSINESAKKIVDIIGVIDGIAFQTNILALNAAVEAARAGEQGRGFAVVATEVRNLAQRSAGAAKEIKTLIGVSVEKVEAGSRLVDQAGSTMQEIVDSVHQVSTIIGEIANASEEQRAGIDQVHQAIGQMDEVTQQNAALVEQAAAASESLREQAMSLSQVVSVFRLEAGEPPQVSLARMPLAPRAKGKAVARTTPQPAVHGGDWEVF